MSSADAFTLWVNNTDFRLFPEEAPPQLPTWCEVSRPLVEWGDTLLRNLTYRPTPDGINLGKWELLDRYCFRYMQASADHRAETNLLNHPCIHQGLLEVWHKLRDLALAIGIRELEQPQRSETHPTVIDAEPEPAATEYNGLVIGQRMR